MRELSLNELALVSGGKHDPNGASRSLGLKGAAATGAASGGLGYVGDVTSGQKQWSMVDAAVATGGGALGGVVGAPHKMTRGMITSAGIGSLTSKYTMGLVNQARSAFGGSSQNNDNNICKAGDDYNK